MGASFDNTPKVKNGAGNAAAAADKVATSGALKMAKVPGMEDGDGVTARQAHRMRNDDRRAAHEQGKAIVNASKGLKHLGTQVGD